MKVGFVQKDLGGVLTHTFVDVPHDGARWSTSPAPSVTVYAAGGGQLIASTAASTGPSTTLSTGASSAASSLGLASTSDLARWAEYKVGPNDAGQWEWVTIDSVSTGGVGLLGKLKYAYESGSKFESHELSFRVSSGVLASVARDCRATWRYTVKGPPPENAPIERKDSSIFHVAYYAPRYNLTEAEVVAEDPRAANLIGSYQRIPILLKRTWERRVLPDIARIMPPGAVVSGEQCDELLLLAFQRRTSLLAKDYEGADAYAEAYKSSLGDLSSMLVDLDESGGTGDAEIPRHHSTPRLMRG